MSTDPTPNYTPREAANYLRVSLTTVRLMLRERRLPFSRVGRRIIIRLADLEALLDTSRVSA